MDDTYRDPKIVIDKDNKPPPHPFYGDAWERGLSPWHRNDFPDEFKDSAPEQGKQKGGWFLLNAYGNQIAFVPDTDSHEND